MSVTNSGFNLECVGHDAVSGTYRFEYNHDVTPPSMAVVQALAEVMDVDPTQVRPLASSVDADALDSVIVPPTGVDAAVEVTVTHEGYDVTVDSHETLTVVSPGRSQTENTDD
ncbi:HalOD1 output domain-containing protein [Halorientalis litorea]|jgi:hypothetical protein|uniref:HalOD1 output domain-containing protein n=1 Tax=Halorientalis litorea TaxID=2931977 RepID=UPI001FF359F5|nr:HalOD1 output domain-containing protein [Halorientalis litorea]